MISHVFIRKSLISPSMTCVRYIYYRKYIPVHVYNIARVDQIHTKTFTFCPVRKSGKQPLGQCDMKVFVCKSSTNFDVTSKSTCANI